MPQLRHTAASVRKDPIEHAQLHKGNRAKRAWGKVARWITQVTGSVWAFMVALGTILAWALTGPIFHFSDTWQLVINTSTTIVTFLMVFLIQQTQNRDSTAVQLKLDEIIASIEGANNKMIDIEDLDEGELKAIAKEYQDLVAKVPKGDTSKRSVADVAGDSHEDNPRQTKKGRPAG